MDEVSPFGDPLVAGVYSEGGDTAWDDFKLLSGVTGLSGSVVDEHADNNSNNSVNGIHLKAGTPSSFYLRIVVDNTNGEHDPVGKLRARGDSVVRTLDEDVTLSGITVNGNTDIYSFRYDGYIAGDFIKIQLNSGVEGEDPGFGDLMFDLVAVEEDADFDEDGDVDGADFLIWQRGFGGTGGLGDGDANNDGDVDAADLAIWQDQFGVTVVVNAANAVPEPAALALALMLCGVLPWVRGRRPAR